MSRIKAITVFLVLSAVGCTSFTATPGKGKGIPIYPAKPYLVVWTCQWVETQTTEERAQDEGEQAIGSKPVVVDRTTTSYEIVYLPDLRRPYGIRMSAFLGKVESNIKVEEGWRLSSSDTTVDTQAAGALKAISDMVKGPAMFPPPKLPPAPSAVTFVIYEFVVSSDGKRMELNQVYPL